MPRKSSIKTLPPEILARLNFLLSEDAMTLAELVAWLDERGHHRSQSSVHRYKQKFEKLQARLRQSREVTAALARELDESALQGQQGRVLVEMARTFVFDLLLRIEEAGEGGGLAPKDVAFLGKGLAELSRALRYDQDFETKIAERVAKEEREKAAAIVDEAGKRGGLSDAAVREIRDRILGVAA